MTNRIVSLLAAICSVLPIGCDDGPVPDDSSTGGDTAMTESEHVGDGQSEEWDICINDSDCLSGDCWYAADIDRSFCGPVACEDDGLPDRDGKSCHRDEDCGQTRECRSYPGQPGGYCTRYDKCDTSPEPDPTGDVPPDPTPGT